MLQDNKYGHALPLLKSIPNATKIKWSIIFKRCALGSFQNLQAQEIITETKKRYLPKQKDINIDNNSTSGNFE